MSADDDVESSDQETHDQGPDAGRLERLANLCILAPIGLVADAGAVIPELVDRGRGQITQARAVGKFAVHAAGGRARDVAVDALTRVAALANSGDGETSSPAEPNVAQTSTDEAPSEGAGVAAEGPQNPSPVSAVPDLLPVEDLAIPDYDSLSASQVVPRLESLAPDELEAVRLYERGSRGRKTVLGRISQLQRTTD